MRKFVVVELRSLSNLIMRYFENSSHKKQVDKITGTNSWIIGYLSENMDKDVYQRDLENQFGITRSTASKVLNLMEQKGLVKRQNVAHDARLKKIVLTQKALDVSKIMEEDSLRLEKTITRGFTSEEYDNLLFYIQKMKNNISKIC